MQYLVSTYFNILNKVNEPTCVIITTEEVINLTLRTDKIGNLVNNSHVSDEISLSDHSYTVFHVHDLVTYCNFKRTNWESYWDDLEAN
jgi:hypothetical protein